MMTSGNRHFSTAARRGTAFAVATVMSFLGLISATPAYARGDIRIPAGTALTVRVETEVRSTTSRPGDEFRATVTTPLVIGGETAVPAGSVVTGSVDNVSARAFGQQ